MVFDNCQIDVFFHMRSHYNRLRSVHSIVDCSAPRGLRRLNQSSTSLQYAGMAPFCNNNSAVKHNCKYNTSCFPVSTPTPIGCSPRAQSLPPRPGTRRHPDDTPLPREMCSRSAKNPVRHPQEFTKTTPVRIVRPNPTPRHRPKTKVPHHVPAISSVYYASKNTSSEGAKLESFHSRSDQDVRSNTAPNLTSVNQMPVSSSEYGEPKEYPKYNTPISTPTNKPSNVSSRDHEYLQFLLKITEDIIQNDLYTNKEMKKVFVSHFNANKGRLDSDRMILQIHQLMQELNIPLSGDDEEDQTPSWFEIESALKGLCTEEMKQKGDVALSISSDSKYKSSPNPQEKCICFDLKNSDESSFHRRKMPEEEVESTNYDDYAPKNKFQSSLDRLTEHTEPISSQATCKASTVTSSSTFGQVEVLPGFECLETPKTAKSGPTEKSSKPQSPEKSERKVSYKSPNRRKNTKKLKRRKKTKISRIKRPKSNLKDATCSKFVENVCQASIVAQSRGTDPHTKEFSSDSVTTKDSQKPLIITLKDHTENQTDANNLFPENAKNDYMLIKGPIYLLKTFLVENPDLVMRIETPSVPSLVISKPSELNNKISNQSNEPKNEEHTEMKEKLLPKTSSIDEVSKESKLLRTDLDTSGKYKEMRNILMQITSDLSLSSSSSSFDSKETIIPFEHFGSTFSTQTDITIASKIATTSAMNFSALPIKTPCTNQSKCSQFCSALTSKPNLILSDDKLLMTDAYDLTPQRDNDVDTSDMDQLIGEDYNVSSILQNFLLNREIQTEDLHVEPTIVAFAKIQKDELPGNSRFYPTDTTETSSTDEVTNILNSLGVNPGKSFSQNVESNIGKKIKSAKKDTSKGYHRDPSESDQVKSVTLRESVFAYPTAPSNKQSNQMPDEVGQEFQMKMMFPFLQNPKLQVETPKADSDEAIAHTRRVSIMRNPIIQLPLDKVAPDDDSKKKAESIMKAVDVFKERQSTKGPSHLKKAVHDMESNRESRLVEKMIQESRQGREIPSTKPISELLNLDTTSIDEVYAIGTEASSYVELPIKLTQRQGEPFDSKKGGEDESHQVQESSSQIRRITLVTEKLDYLKNADDDDDYEISATLDQLALLLKQEQEEEENIEIKDESTPEQQSDTTVNKKYFRCCNFRRKKAALPKKNIQEPSQRDSFSEKQYRSKSEAFEMALIALGQASTPTPETDSKATEKATGSDLMEVSSAQSIVLALGGTKLPALKLGPQAEKNVEGGIKIDFDVISTMALRVDDEKTASFHPPDGGIVYRNKTVVDNI